MTMASNIILYYKQCPRFKGHLLTNLINVFKTVNYYIKLFSKECACNVHM